MRALAAFALLIGLAGPAAAQHKPGSHGPPHVGPHVKAPSSVVHTPRTPRVIHSSPSTTALPMPSISAARRTAKSSGSQAPNSPAA